jgi:epoxyqueuosine reductase
LHEAEPLIRSHAAWALGRLGGGEARQALQAVLSTERDADVREEITLALTELVEEDEVSGVAGIARAR